MSKAVTERSWCVVVPHHPRGARVARQRLTGELSAFLRPAELADVVAIAAELVGNAILHADPLPGGVLRVAWRVHRTGPGWLVAVLVTDGGAAGVPSIRTVDPDADDGRGLTIVAALADRWGVRKDGLGQSVWAELSAPAPPGPASSAPGPPGPASSAPGPPGPASSAPGSAGSAPEADRSAARLGSG